ncbi:MAG: hypothetical protein IPN33_11540, partial [Saprospiraceae bacterium]|nr:hypothetical protein [Saprospiraceae bacterium]
KTWPQHNPRHAFRLVVDPVNGKLLWGDSNLGKLERSNLDGSSRETLLTNFTTRGFAIHENIDQTFTEGCNPNDPPPYWLFQRPIR